MCGRAEGILGCNAQAVLRVQVWDDLDASQRRLVALVEPPRDEKQNERPARDASDHRPGHVFVVIGAPMTMPRVGRRLAMTAVAIKAAAVRRGLLQGQEQTDGD